MPKGQIFSQDLLQWENYALMKAKRLLKTKKLEVIVNNHMATFNFIRSIFRRQNSVSTSIPNSLSRSSSTSRRIFVLVHCIWWISIRQQQSDVIFEFSLKIVARHFFWGLNRFCAIVSPCLTFCQTRWISHNPILEILLQEMSPHFIFFWRDDILDKLIRGDT